MTAIGTKSLLALLVAAVLSLFGGPLMAQDAAPTDVPLTLDGCPKISQGQFVTLTWNPGFDVTAEVTGLDNMELYFIKRGDDERAIGKHRALVLSAVPPRGVGPRLASAITPEPNGYFQIRFPVHLEGQEPGEYFIFRSHAEARLDPTYQGKPPLMTNDPANTPFCVTLESRPQGRTR